MWDFICIRAYNNFLIILALHLNSSCWYMSFFDMSSYFVCNTWLWIASFTGGVSSRTLGLLVYLKNLHVSEWGKMEKVTEWHQNPPNFLSFHFLFVPKFPKIFLPFFRGSEALTKMYMTTPKHVIVPTNICSWLLITVEYTSKKTKRAAVAP